MFSPSHEVAVHVKGQCCTVHCIKGYSEIRLHYLSVWLETKNVWLMVNTSIWNLNKICELISKGYSQTQGTKQSRWVKSKPSVCVCVCVKIQAIMCTAVGTHCSAFFFHTAVSDIMFFSSSFIFFILYLYAFPLVLSPILSSVVFPCSLHAYLPTNFSFHFIAKVYVMIYYAYFHQLVPQTVVPSHQ